MRLLTWIATLIAAGSAASGACRNECDFRERCEGNVRQVCGGVDQVVGRKVIEQPCAAPNDTCVADGPRALCVRAPATRCDAGFAARCEGEVEVRCLAGFVVATDCAAVRRPDGSNAGLTCRAQPPNEAGCMSAR